MSRVGTSERIIASAQRRRKIEVLAVIFAGRKAEAPSAPYLQAPSVTQSLCKSVGAVNLFGRSPQHLTLLLVSKKPAETVSVEI